MNAKRAADLLIEVETLNEGILEKATYDTRTRPDEIIYFGCI